MQWLYGGSIPPASSKTTDMRDYSKEISDFQQYVYDFYNNRNGVYPIATADKIYQCVNQYIESKPLSELYFDSFDREQVRTILEPNYSIL